MAYILSIESSTSVCSVAIHENGKLLGLMELQQENVHSKQLMLLIESLLARTTDSGIDQINAIAVSTGPGSYTGLRIGVAIAKGLAFAKEIPLIGVDTMKALAKRVQPFILGNAMIIPMLDARRMEVYAAVYSQNLSLIEEVSPLVIESINPFMSYLSKVPVYFLGDGVMKLRGILEHPNAVFLEVFPSAESFGLLAFEKYQDQVFEDIAYFEPNYLKDFRVLTSKKNLLLS